MKFLCLVEFQTNCILWLPLSAAFTQQQQQQQQPHFPLSIGEFFFDLLSFFFVLSAVLHFTGPANYVTQISSCNSVPCCCCVLLFWQAIAADLSTGRRFLSLWTAGEKFLTHLSIDEWPNWKRIEAARAEAGKRPGSTALAVASLWTHLQWTQNVRISVSASHASRQRAACHIIG